MFATCHSSVLVQWEFRFVIQHSGLTVLLVGFKLYICHGNLSCRLYSFLVLCVTVQPLSRVDIHFAVFHGTELNNNWFKFFQGVANGSYMQYWATGKEAFKMHSEIVCLITTCYHLIIWLGFFDTSSPNDKTHVL